MSYFGIHNHSDFSNIRLIDSIQKVEKLIDSAHSLGLSGIALTDHETTSGWLRFQKHLEKRKEENPDDPTWQNFTGALGNEIYLVRDGLNLKNYNKEIDRYFHFILIAKDEIGARQIREISTRAWRRSYFYFQRRVPTYYSDLEEILGKDKGHVVLSTACLGSFLGFKLMQAAQYEGKDQNKYIEIQNEIVDWINQIKGYCAEGDLYLEFQPSFTEEQIYVNKKILRISEALNVPYVVSTDAHYSFGKDRSIHKAFLNSKEAEREVDDFYSSTYLMSEEDIWDYVKDYMSKEQLEKAFDYSNEIKNKIEDYSIKQKLKIPYIPTKEKVVPTPIESIKNSMPNLMKFFESEHVPDVQLASRLYYFIINPPYELKEEHLQRIDYELSVILDSSIKQEVQWSAYLLQMADYLDICWNEGDSLVCPSRGSAGASYVMYILGVIQIDPMREKAPLLFERFMNPERASVLDVDVDVQSNKRDNCIASLQKVYGKENVIRVSTFKTEKAKSAIQTAARGLGIDVDTAQYLSSFIGAERGIQYTLTDVYYGNEEKDLKPNTSFIKELETYPEVWEVAKNIEGLINGCSSHAGGVIVVDEPITNRCAVMTTTKGEFISQFDLHDAEECGLIKIDLLSTDGLTKIRACLDLLIEYGYVEEEATLKETYEKIIGVYNLEREDSKMWEMIWDGEIISLFQMEQQSGVQGIAATKPANLEQLATLNSVMRLMAPNRDDEQPIQKYARFSSDIEEWYKEMDMYGLSLEEKELLKEKLAYSNGICAQQEDLYNLMTDKKIAGWTFSKADELRKCIAKKKPEDFLRLQNEFYSNAEENKLSYKLCKYVWEVLVKTQRGYSFNLAHCLSYSIIGLQEMNLAYKYPIVFWNCANLIVDSGSDYNLIDEEEIEIITEEIDDEEVEEEEIEKKITPTDYGKMAVAIGKMASSGVLVYPPDINTSKLTFSPDVEDNSIRYGLSGITRVGDAIVEEIINKRPYISIDDFLSKVKVNKPQMVNLIKAGTFDKFGESRYEIMDSYIRSISDQKKTVNLRNYQMLSANGLLPELEFETKVFHFNKYLKKFKEKEFYMLDERALVFYENNFDMDKLSFAEDEKILIEQQVWDKKYQSIMNKARDHIKKNHDVLLEQLNNKLIEEMWDKYCKGNISKWEMDSISYYSHEHELEFVDDNLYGLVDFYDLPEEPEVAYTFTTKDGKRIPLFKLNYIAGTVLKKDKMKQMVTILTKSGVVNVKIYGAFKNYDKQISMKDLSTGKKKVMEKSWFSRGNKIIVCGIRRGAEFFAKKYKNTQGHLVNLITEVTKEGDLIIQEERIEVE